MRAKVVQHFLGTEKPYFDQVSLTLSNAQNSYVCLWMFYRQLHMFEPKTHRD